MKEIEIFDLNNTNENYSFYYKIDDFLSLMGEVSDIFLTEIFNQAFRTIYINSIIEDEYLQEIVNDLYPKINRGQKSIHSIFKELQSNISEENLVRKFDSFDELVLYKLLTESIDSKYIEPQFRFEGQRKAYDFKVATENKTYLIEFEGIGHFYGNNASNPIDKLQTEFNGNYTLILWPYWIKKCQRNVEIILGIDSKNYGLGAIWSSDKHFSEIDFNGSSETIISLNAFFNIDTKNGIGHIYYKNSGVINKINYKRAISWTNDKLIPQEIQNERNYWLPNCLREE